MWRFVDSLNGRSSRTPWVVERTSPILEQMSANDTVRKSIIRHDEPKVLARAVGGRSWTDTVAARPAIRWMPSGNVSSLLRTGLRITKRTHGYVGPPKDAPARSKISATQESVLRIPLSSQPETRGGTDEMSALRQGRTNRHRPAGVYRGEKSTFT